MPDYQSEATAIRASGHSVRVYASVYVGEIVAVGTVQFDMANGGNFVVVSSVSVGDLMDAAAGMEVYFYTSGMELKGRTHIRYGSFVNPGGFPIRELSWGTFKILAGDMFVIRREFRLHDKLVGAVAEFPPDYLYYADAGDPGANPSPVACSGGHYAAFVDAYDTATPATFATVQMTGSTSYSVDPDGPGTVSHLWTLPTGVAFASGSSATDADPVLEADVGSWAITHAVTDDLNSKVTTQYPVIIVHDAAHLPYDLLLEGGLQTDEQYGWRAAMRVFQDATLEDIPDGALVLLWTRERIGGAWQSFGNATPGRESMLLVGYAHSDTNTADAYIRKTSFEIISPLQRLDQIAGYSKVMEQSATPDAWSKLKGLTTKRATVQLLYYYTTLVESGFDLIFDNGYLNKTYPALYLQRSTPLQQVRELAHGVDARLTCDPSARFDLYTHPAYIPLASRAAVTVTFDLSEDDIIDLSFTRPHFDSVEIMKTSGFIAGTSPQSIFSLYPGNAPGEAIDTPVSDRLICDSQDDLNNRTGRYGALNDLRFIDANGEQRRAFEINLTLYGSYNFFRLYKEYVEFSVDGTSNLRGIDLSAFRYWLKSVNVTYDGGTARTRLALVAETSSNAGTTFTPPPQSSNGLPPITTPILPPVTQPTLPSWMLAAGTGKIALICVNGLYLTQTFNNTSAQGGPVWGFVAKPWSGTLLQWVPRGGTTPAAGWVVTTTEVGYLVLSTGAYTSLYTFGSSSVFRAADASFAESGFFSVISFYNASGTKSLATTDNFLTVVGSGEITINSDTTTSTPGCYVSSKTAGKIVASAMTGFPTSSSYQSPDYGASWSLMSPSFVTSVIGNINIFAPWANNTGDNIYYYSAATNLSPIADTHRFYRFMNGASVEIAPYVTGERYMPYASRNTAETSAQNANRLLMVGRRSEGGGPTMGVFLTDNARAVVPVWSTVVAPASNFRRCAISGNNQNIAWIWGVSNAVEQLTISGGTVLRDSRTGNLASLSPGEIIGFAGW